MSACTMTARYANSRPRAIAKNTSGPVATATGSMKTDNPAAAKIAPEANGRRRHHRKIPVAVYAHPRVTSIATCSAPLFRSAACPVDATITVQAMPAATAMLVPAVHRPFVVCVLDARACVSAAIRISPSDTLTRGWYTPWTVAFSQGNPGIEVGVAPIREGPAGDKMGE